MLFGTKLRAPDDYRRATSQVDLDVRLAVVSIPRATDNPNKLSEMTDSQMRDIALVARPCAERYQSLVATTDATNTQWSQQVRTAVNKAQMAALENARCFITLG